MVVMRICDRYKELAAAVVLRACNDLEDPRQQLDAYKFLYSEWGMSLRRWAGEGIAESSLNRQISSIITCEGLGEYSVRQYLREHTLSEAAIYYDVGEEDLRNYCERHHI